METGISQVGYSVLPSYVGWPQKGEGGVQLISAKQVPQCPVCGRSKVKEITPSKSILKGPPVKITYRCSGGHTFMAPSEERKS